MRTVFNQKDNARNRIVVGTVHGGSVVRERSKRWAYQVSVSRSTFQAQSFYLDDSRTLNDKNREYRGSKPICEATKVILEAMPRLHAFLPLATHEEVFLWIISLTLKVTTYVTTAATTRWVVADAAANTFGTNNVKIAKTPARIVLQDSVPGSQRGRA